MSGTDAPTAGDLAARVDEAVRTIAGVSELYFAVPLAARVWRVAVSPEQPTYASVVARDGTWDVTVSIGVSQDRADAVARLVAARVREVLGDSAAAVTVRVSRLSVS